MLFALFIGLGFGFALQYLAQFPDSKEASAIIWYNEAKHWFGFVSSVFVAFIKMLVIPLVGICIIKVIIEIDKNIKISSLLSISLFWILFSTAIAASLGILLAYNFQLGDNFTAYEGTRQIREIQTFSSIILGLIPSNIISVMNKENIIAIVIFAFLWEFAQKSFKKKNMHKLFKLLKILS